MAIQGSLFLLPRVRVASNLRDDVVCAAEAAQRYFLLMLSCQGRSVGLSSGGTRIPDRVTARLKSKALNAVIGSLGCGTAILVRAMLDLFTRIGEVCSAGDRSGGW